MNLTVFLADWSLKSAVIIGLAFVCQLAFRKRSASARHLVWRIALAAVALLPLVMGPISRSSAPAVIEPIQAPVRVVFTKTVLTSPIIQPSPQAPLPESLPSSGQILLAVYGIGVIVLFLRWAIGFLKIRKIVSHAWESEPLSGVHPVLVASTEELRVPITLGLRKPIILLPKEAELWPESRVRSAVLHETAHIERRDWAW